MFYAKYSTIPFLFLLLDCATPTVEIKQVCLPLVSYSQEMQTNFAKELTKLQNSPVIEKFLGDYKALRDADRVCQNG